MSTVRILLSVLLYVVLSTSYAAKVVVDIDSPDTIVDYAKARLVISLDKAPGFKKNIHLSIDNSLTAEAFVLKTHLDYVSVVGGDSNGVLYGALDLIEQLANGANVASIQTKSEAPFYPFRAIKFNLPWFSYRFGPVIDQHKEVARDLDYWRRFLDMMAENRFNALSLWNLHPYGYMIRSKNFPFACEHKTDQELEDWQHFFRELFRMAKERGIETYIVNWNIFVPKGFQEHYKLPRDRNIHKWNETVSKEMDDLIRQYTRESVTQVLEEYPDLTGIGLSLGEAMNGMTSIQRQEWISDTIVRGVQEAKRPARLIHRVPFAGGNRNFGNMDKETEILTRKTLESIEGVKGDILVEVKFNWSHAHSTPKLVKVHGGEITDSYWNPLPKNYKLAWMARNEDFFVLRWGDASFIREHLRLNKKEYVAGYFIGSEGYIPALDYFTKPKMKVDWDYAFERQWLFYKLWGRLIYNPQTPDSVFTGEFIRRYGESGRLLFDAYQLASQIPEMIAANWNVTNDRSLYSEGFMSKRRTKGKATLISVASLIQESALDPSYVSIKEYVDGYLKGKVFSVDRITPLQLAGRFEDLARRAGALVAGIKTGKSDSLKYEVGDVRAWSNLGLYVAEKIRGATAFHIYKQRQDDRYKAQSIRHLKKAQHHWQNLVKVTEPLYDSMYCLVLPNGSDEKWHWSTLEDEVQADIDYVKSE